MFTWICPQCGREVPPAYTDCPDCSKKTAPADASVAATEAPPQAAPQQQAPAPLAAPYTPPPPPPQPEYQPAAAYAPPPPAPMAPVQRGGLPTWLLTVLFAFAFLGLGSGIYWLVGAARGSNAKPTAAVESPAAKPSAKTSPFQKYIEISRGPVCRGPEEKDRSPLRSNEPFQRRYLRARRECDGVGPDAQFGRGCGRNLHFHHRLEGIRIEGSLRAAEYEAQNLRTARLAEREHGRSDHRAGQPVEASFSRF